MKYEYYSQNWQDKFLDKDIFKGKTGGVFLDIGASESIVGHGNFAGLLGSIVKK